VGAPDLVALFDDLAHAVDVGEVQLGSTLGVQVQCHGHQVDVTGALAVAEQAAFDAIGAGHQAQLGGGDAGATVVVGVQADDHAVAAVDIAAEPFDLVGVDVRRGALDGGRQVEDHLVLRRRVPHLDHRVTDFLGELQLGGAEGFRRVFEGPLGFRLLGGVFDEQLGGVDRDGLDAFLVLVEDDAAERREVALYRWTMAFFAPRRDSKVRAIRSSRPWVSTWMVVSSGMWPSSIRVRTKSKSVCEADGNEASISFTPTCTRVFQKRSFFSESIGSISDWLPSRRSELHQIGAW
jgi:hypothetical protein